MALANQVQMNGTEVFGENVELKGTVFSTWTEDQWIQLGIEMQNWSCRSSCTASRAR